jgi:MFS-type transporter involved in bile tolerance (Atg22 family)
MRGVGASGGEASSPAAFSWILYEFSNTIFSIAFLSFMVAGLFLLRASDASPEPNVDEFTPETDSPLDSPAP